MEYYELKENLKNWTTNGAMVGGLIGASAAVIGGYELGSVVNNYFNIENVVARSAIDVVVSCILLPPAVSMGVESGKITGSITWLGYNISRAKLNELNTSIRNYISKNKN